MEDLRLTAVREVFEETGVWGKICENLGPVSYTVKGEVVTTQFYLMRYAGCGLKEDVNREHRWLTIENMSESASYLETCDLLKLAESKLKHAGVKPKPLVCYVVDFLKRIFKF
jgi:ADP-ribose pyrophosphatase YjhB (NUDIX family)